MKILRFYIFILEYPDKLNDIEIKLKFLYFQNSVNMSNINCF